MRSYLFLEENGVPYTRVSHDEAATIEMCKDVEKVLGAPICKNLLLCNRQQTDYYLLLMPGDLPFKTKLLSSQIGSARLSFADGEQMWELLGVKPGSLTVLALLNDPDKRVRLLVETHLLDAEWFACHPCVNTATVKFRTADLFEKLLPALGRDYTPVNLEEPLER